MTQKTLAQNSNSISNHNQEKSVNNFPRYDKVILPEPTPDTTANVSMADFDGDGHPDVLLVKGRHWPMIDRIFLGNGSGGIKKAYDLGKVADRS